jgi:hypothetical protein
METLEALKKCREWFEAMDRRGYVRVLVATQPAGFCLDYLDEALREAEKVNLPFPRVGP